VAETATIHNASRRLALHKSAGVMKRNGAPAYTPALWIAGLQAGRAGLSPPCPDGRRYKFMQCPKCKIELLASVREGIEIDCCPKCGGIWLDHGELRDMIAAYIPHFAVNETATPQSSDPPDRKFARS
jgi:Zn-finger nucleic acid-binding protein